MNYKDLIFKLKHLDKKYNVKTIGKTKLNRKIFAVEKIENKSFSTAIFVAGIHARENITCDLIFKMLQENVFDEIHEFNLSFVVMANPDGVELQNFGLEKIPKKYRKNIQKINKNSSDFSLWKANAFGVDLNNNFNARFGTNVDCKTASSSGFAGKHAESERETKAIVRYTKKVKPFFTISYHSKGEEIYFNFFQSKKHFERDALIAKKFAKSTGYKIVNVEKSSSGGYKDWCVEKLNIPAITIEIGDDNWVHPIGLDHLQEIFDKNKSVASDVNFAYNVFNKYKDSV